MKSVGPPVLTASLPPGGLVFARKARQKAGSPAGLPAPPPFDNIVDLGWNENIQSPVAVILAGGLGMSKICSNWLCFENLRDDLLRNHSRNVRQPEIAAAELVRQLLVVEAQKV